MITPMQELIEWIYTIISVLPDGSGAKNQMIIAKEKAESMLEKEKEVMIDFAYKFGDEPLVDIAKWYNKQFNGLGYGFVADLKQKPIRKH